MIRRKLVIIIIKIIENIYLLLRVSKKLNNVIRRPETATGFITCLSVWNGDSDSVPLPMCVRPCAMRTINK